AARRNGRPHADPRTDGTKSAIGWETADEPLSLREQADRAVPLLAAIVDSSDDAIVSKDLNGVITSWNKVSERLFRYLAPEAMGKNITLITPHERLSEERAILEQLRAGKRIDHFETVRRHKNGSTVDISLTVSPVRDATGRIVGASKVARDISERKKAI